MGYPGQFRGPDPDDVYLYVVGVAVVAVRVVHGEHVGFSWTSSFASRAAANSVSTLQNASARAFSGMPDIPESA